MNSSTDDCCSRSFALRPEDTVVVFPTLSGLLEELTLDSLVEQPWVLSRA